jgi:hypothetical protein
MIFNSIMPLTAEQIQTIRSSSRDEAAFERILAALEPATRRNPRPGCRP